MGCAAILMCGEKTHEVSEGHPAASVYTDNRAELLAAILGLKALTKPCLVMLLTDNSFKAGRHGSAASGWRG
jgi:ribonuclease HI